MVPISAGNRQRLAGHSPGTSALLRGAACALGACALLHAAPAAAQRQDKQIWFQTNTNLPIAPQVRLTLEQIARISDRSDGLYQTEFGALLGYRVAKGVEVGFGYRRVGAHNLSNAATEDRLRQQVVANFGRIATRFRIDERFHPDGDEIGFRIRTLLRYNQPVGPKGLVLFVSHESIMLANSTSWGQRSGYDRMRNLIGINAPIGKKASVDIGYLNQYRPGRRESRGQMDHALSVQLTINLPNLLTILDD